MDRLQRAVVLLNLIDMLGAKGSRCGETHIQKAVYFSQTMFNVPIDYQFVLYKYGPFSFELSDELVRIRADGLLKSVPTPPFGVTFHLEKAGNQLRAKFSKTGKRYEGIINLLTDEIGDKGVKELERLATIQYIKIKCAEKQSPDALAGKLIELKPHIAEDEAKEAVIAFEELKERLK